MNLQKLKQENKKIVNIVKTNGGYRVYYQEINEFNKKIKEEYEKRKEQNKINVAYEEYKKIDKYKANLDKVSENIKREIVTNEYICNRNCYHKSCYNKTDEWRKKCILMKIIMFKRLKSKKNEDFDINQINKKLNKQNNNKLIS